MATNGQLLARVARGETLLESEIQQLERALGDYDDTRNRVLGTFSGNTTAEKLFVRDVEWKNSPLHNYSFQRQADLTVVNNTLTYITFDLDYQHGKYFQWDENDKSKILIRYPGNNFMVNGVIQWDNLSAVGYRYMAMEGFKQDGTSLGFVGLHLFPGFTAEDNYFPVSYVADLRQLLQMAYVKFFVRQTSGADLIIRQILLNMFVV
jgi:hypothetical protein